jgi:apolipoprotein N-acyltransferase
MVRPVPFGEYIPARVWAFFGFGPALEEVLLIDITAGRGERPLRGIATPICFEATFPEGARDLVGHGGRLIVTVTNDAWFGLSAQRDAHFAFAVFRAIENRRWMIQSANGGISGAVSPVGKVTAMTRGEGVLVTEVAERTDRSVYTHVGDLPILCASGAALLAALVGRRRSELAPARLPERTPTEGSERRRSLPSVADEGLCLARFLPIVCPSARRSRPPQ